MAGIGRHTVKLLFLARFGGLINAVKLIQPQDIGAVISNIGLVCGMWNVEVC